MHVSRLATSIVAAWLIAITSPPAADAAPARVPNKQPYRVTARATVTGRTGSAMMSARALIDRDQHGSLEVVSGDFETPPVGTLARFQLKTYDGNGDLVSTNSYSGLNNASLVMPISRLDRGQALDIQGNIRNVDNTRTDVVSVTAVAALRPDIAVLRVSAPAVARVGFPVQISAAIAELNHDTGARASCVLFVDAAPVDQAEGIWVDAGDTVSCAFTHVFAAGAHELRVDATHVNPGDWDTGNNSASGSVTVLADEVPFDAVSAWVAEEHDHYRIHSTGYSRHNDGSGYIRSFDVLMDQARDTQEAQYSAYVAGLVNFPLTQVAVAQWTDDTLIHRGVYNGFAATSSTASITCGNLLDDAGLAVYVAVCVRGAGTDAVVTLVTYTRYVGAVTYFSSQYDAAWYETPYGNVPIYTYSNNNGQSASVGSLASFGSTYRFEVSLLSGATEYSKPVSMALGPIQVRTDVTHPWVCQEFSDPLYGYKKICDEYINLISGRFAAVNWP
jgi:hypothetical protein